VLKDKIPMMRKETEIIYHGFDRSRVYGKGVHLSYQFQSNVIDWVDNQKGDRAMKNKWTVVGASLLGALVVYCCQNAMTSLSSEDTSGPIGDAGAQTDSVGCCEAGYTELARVTLTSDASRTEAIDVSRFREVSILASTETTYECDDVISVLFYTADEGYDAWSPAEAPGARIPVLGPIIKVHKGVGDALSPCEELSLVVLGLN
jgi:hypothetical protein